jgi:magnesium transporter
MGKSIPFSQKKISSLMHQNFIALNQDMTVREGLDLIREQSEDVQILYFYIVDDNCCLEGVVSTRQMLISSLNTKLKTIMDKKVRYISADAEVMDVLTEFVIHKYLALPVVAKDRKLVGIIDVSVFTENISDILERDNASEVFETIGFHLNQIKGASPFKAFRIRFPWLLATIFSGVLCAILASRFENILEASIILSFFLTLILGLGESVSMQSMTLTIQALRAHRPTMHWFGKEMFKELGTAILLGFVSGSAVALTVFIWKGEVITAVIIGGSLIFSLTASCLAGLSIPTLIHSLRLDPKISAGPLTLAIADLFTIFIYFNVANWVL